MKFRHQNISKSIFGIAMLCCAIIAPLQAATAKVSSKLEAYTVLIDKDGNEEFKKATQITPGGIIEYRISYENNTEAPLSNFIVNGEVPNSTIYLHDSQKVDQQSVFEAEVADLGWQEIPIFREVVATDGRVQRVKVPVTEYQNVRWRLVEAVAPGSSVEAVYRIKVER